MSSDQTTQCEKISTVSTDAGSTTSQRLTGMVKWFNNKSGFGFISVCGTGEFSGKDIFVHYSSIRVTNSQYKYLVQGEYVDFVLVKSENDKHEYHATDITGVLGGAIMCETRRVAMDAQPDRSDRVDKFDHNDKPDRAVRQYKTRQSNFDDRNPRSTQSSSGSRAFKSQDTNEFASAPKRAFGRKPAGNTQNKVTSEQVSQSA